MKRGVSLEAARAAKQRAAEVVGPLVGDELAVGITRLGDDGFALKVNLTSEPGGENVQMALSRTTTVSHCVVPGGMLSRAGSRWIVFLRQV